MYALIASTTETSADPILILLKALLVALVSAIFFGVFLGFTDRAVFYYNRRDVAISFAPYLTVAAGGILSLMFQESQPILILIIIATALASSYFFGLSAYNAHKYNGGLLWKAIPITLAKLFMSFIFLLNLLDAFNDKNPKRVESALWTLAIGWLISHLVNGERILGSKTLHL